ncbi:MAG: DinB family protein [Candidatus Pseudobacter hemicellulosilyticus]|uniref:DinB family protein n=1 Tax=Candidatus Pseudobacter hemicellulosilyticus TaxID=3121375 RepID=A0AAJ6BGN3_9BACT|nr:MAG: DinB family protein [Pseudobacter sp.]
MTKQDIQQLPEYFDRYIHAAPDMPLTQALETTGNPALMIPLAQLAALGTKTYAPGKWTIPDIVQHLIDTERVLSYRALRLARNDRTPLPGFEQDLFAEYAQATDRSLNDLLQEWRLVRESSKALFWSFSPDMYQRKGICSGMEIAVLSLGYVIAGHPVYHWKIVQERYLPLLQQ